MTEKILDKKTKVRPFAKTFLTPSLTQQHFKDECDINNILRKFSAGTPVTHVAKRQPMYGDFTTGLGYQEAMNRVIEAQQAFLDLPATLRRRFHDDPGEFLEFVANEENRDEAIRLGLIEDPEPPAPEPEAPPALEPSPES